ncbi:MAG TPA: DUF1318 domain-containing protein [bacterium]|nr:DUF1318 domain-containing protein [bacterium]
MKKLTVCFFFLLMTARSVPLWAAGQYDIKQRTPEIEQAFAGRQSRFQELRALKSSGRIGEDNHGYVEALDQSAEHEGIIRAENADRSVIYNAIVEQNNLGRNGLPQVEAIFAGVRREKAEAGDSIQLPSGERIRK